MRLYQILRSIIIMFLFFIYTSHAGAQDLSQVKINNLRTEYKINPVGIDVLHPRLSWELISEQRDVSQSAFQIRSAATETILNSEQDLLWDSGKINSDQSIHVSYGGPALKSGHRVYWQVRIWDEKNLPSKWSEAAYFEMGLLNSEDWKASWIQFKIEEDVSKSQPCHMLRKEFSLNGEVASARAYITCHGLYEMQLNGRRVGDQLFTPGWTSYNKRLQYQTYDIGNYLTKGQNAVTVTLGDGWYRGFLGWRDKRNNYGEKLALLLQITVTYKDGSSEIIVSDATWKASTGPILMSDIYNGEIYDARLEKKGWSKAGFNDQDWLNVEVVEYSKEILVAPVGPPVQKIEELKPKNIFTTPKGEIVYDMGQNMVGWVRLKVKGKAGTTVTLRHAEVLDKEGNIYTDNLRSAKQTVQYTLKGNGEEIFKPHFTFQGFRYVAIEGYPGKPTLQDITGIVIHSDLQPTGTFHCSNEMINQLQHNIKWGQKGNFLDVPTDCPQRDERMGWTGDAQVFAPTACFNYDVAAFYTKWVRDLAADQFENGIIPHVIPDVLGQGGATAWADAGVIIPWTVYLYYGDKRILAEQYESMQAWISYMQEQAGDKYIWDKGFHFGDWLAYNTTRSDYPGATTDKDLIATAYFAYSTSLMQKIAQVLNKMDDAEKYGNLLDNIKRAFNKEYVTPNGRLASNTQTAYSLALAFALLPDSQMQQAAQRIADDVKAFGHITTGFVGTPLICHVLSNHGYIDLAYMLLNRKEYPSWLYPITMGATTIWERWDGIKSDSTFQDAGMNSFNHYAYGAVGDWLYRIIAGIEVDASAPGPGFKHIRIQPRPGGGITQAGGSIHSMYGMVESSWKIVQDRFSIVITIPANTHATAILPHAKLEEVRESGKAVTSVKEIKYYKQNGDSVMLTLGSGHYQFTYPWRAK